MKLTGKALIEFEKWYLKNTKYDFSLNYIRLCNDVQYVFHNQKMLLAFNCSPEAMQYGIIVDWFESLDLDIDVDVFKLIDEDFYGYMISGDHNEHEFETRPQARTAAIHKANEIINNLK